MRAAAVSMSHLRESLTKSTRRHPTIDFLQRKHVVLPIMSQVSQMVLVGLTAPQLQLRYSGRTRDLQVESQHGNWGERESEVPRPGTVVA